MSEEKRILELAIDKNGVLFGRAGDPEEQFCPIEFDPTEGMVEPVKQFLLERSQEESDIYGPQHVYQLILERLETGWQKYKRAETSN